MVFFGELVAFYTFLVVQNSIIAIQLENDLVAMIHHHLYQ